MTGESTRGATEVAKDEIEWPPLPSPATGATTDPQAEYKKALYEAQIKAVVDAHQPPARADVEKARAELVADLRKARVSHAAELRKLEVAADIELRKLASETDLEIRKLETATAKDIEKANATVDGEIAKLEKELAIDRVKAEWANDYVLEQGVQGAYVELAKGSIDRLKERAEWVEKAAAALGTAYTGVLVLSFVAKDAPLPGQGLAAPLFFGLAVTMAAFYLTFLTKRGVGRNEQPMGTLDNRQVERLNTFILWSVGPSQERLHFLRASAVSLGLGVLFMPAAYLPAAELEWLIRILILAVAGVLVVALVATDVDQRRGQRWWVTALGAIVAITGIGIALTIWEFKGLFNIGLRSSIG